MNPNYLVPAAYALLWAPWISAQDSPPVVFASTFVEDQWTTEQGLVQNEVTDIELTADGYVWISSFGGLARFDGVRFTTFTVANTPELLTNRCLSLHEDSRGALWIGTLGKGVVRYEDGVFTPIRDGVPRGEVWAISEDRDGSIWMVGHGVGRYVPGRGSALGNAELVLPGVPATDVQLDSLGRMWIATASGLYRYEEGQFTHLAVGGSERLYSLANDPQLGIWAASRSLVGRVGEDGQFLATATHGAGRSFDLTIDTGNRVWVSGGNGIYVGGAHAGQALEGFQRFDHDITKDGVRVLEVSEQGVLWFGTEGHGILRMQRAPFSSIGGKWNVPKGAGRSLISAGQGRVLLWDSEWTLMWDRVRFRDPRDSWPPWSPLTDRVGLLGAADGALWVCAKRGLLRIPTRDPKDVTQYDSFGLLQGVVKAMNGSIWFGAVGGLLEKRADRFVVHETPVLPMTPLVVEAVDSAGAIWFRGQTCVGRLRDESFEVYDRENGLPRGEIRDVYLDRDDTAWVSTYGGGLARIKNSSVVALGDSEGMADASLGGIIEDDEGRLWVNSNSGVLILNKVELNAVANGDLDRFHCRLLNTPEGNGGDAAVDDLGRMWFPTVTGAIVTKPELHHPSTRAPQLHIEGLRVEDVAQRLGAELEFGPGVSDLEIDYTGISDRDSRQINFRYRLEGYQEDWEEVGSRRTAYFTKVPPGKYVFHVIAANEDGYWSEEGAQLAITLLPRFYQTKWFAPLMVLLASGILGSLHRRRVNGITRHAQELQREIAIRERAEEERSRMEKSLLESSKLEALGRLAGGISHDFNNVLTAILGHTELMREKLDRRDNGPYQDRLVEHVDGIHECGERAAALTKQLLAFGRQQVLKPKVLDPNDVIEGVKPMLQQLMPQHTKLDCRPSKVPNIRVDPGQLEQVVMNLVLNSRDAMPDGGQILIKTVAVTLEGPPQEDSPLRAGQHVLISVTDSGEGIEEANMPNVFEPFFTTKGQGTGLGLATVYGIVNQSQGHILVHSERGVGTTFNVYFPAVDLESELGLTPAPALPQSLSGSEKLLVCEDDPEILATMSASLSSLGYEVLESASPSEAMEIARRETDIDLLITDVLLPEENGRVLATEITELHPDAPVLFISGYSNNVFEHQGDSDEEIHFLRKPFTFTQLREQVRALLDRGPLVR